MIRVLRRAAAMKSGYPLFGAEHASAYALVRRELGEVSGLVGRVFKINGPGRQLIAALESQPGRMVRR